MKVKIKINTGDKTPVITKSDIPWQSSLEKRKRKRGFFKNGFKGRGEKLHIADIRELMLNEAHHNFYGGSWCIGKYQYEIMLKAGLLKKHKLLDLGCGALRAGIWLIDYLETGNYYGIDSHYYSLLAGADYEIPYHNLESKEPNLIYDEKFNIDQIKVYYDYVMAFSLFIHLSDAEVKKALTNIYNSIGKEGKLILNKNLPFKEKDIEIEYGFILEKKEKYYCEINQKEIEWFMLRKA